MKCVLVALFLSAVVVQAEEIVGLTASNKLIRFDSKTPGTLSSTVQITGLQSGEVIVGIDFRPLTGQFYGVGSTNRIYLIDVTSGLATVVGTAVLNPVLNGVRFGVDFNPTADRLRVISDNNQSLRINVDTGVVTNNDTALAFSTLDTNAGKTPRVISAAYTNSTSNSASTTLYGLDSTVDSLVTVGSINSTVSPNGGQVFTVGKLGLDITDVAGFDISGQTNTAFASLMLNGASVHQLYTINLSTGSATLLGDIAAGELLIDVALVAAPTPFDMVALSTTGTLARFDSRTPSVFTNPITVTGLQPGEILKGIDFRPLTGELFGLSDGGRTYVVSPITGVATVVGTALVPALTSSEFGFDFNPTVDRIRVVNIDNENVRLNPATGTVLVDTPVAYIPGDVNAANDPNIVAVAYTNNVIGGVTTTLYGIDASQDTLVTFASPNGGTLSTVAALSVAANNNTGFDISPAGVAFASLNDRLYTVNLTNGALTQVGTQVFGGSTVVADIAFVTQSAQQTLAFSAATFAAIEGSTAALTVVRGGPPSGVVSVDYEVVAGTAISGTDFTATKGTLTFLNGETSRTILVPTLNNKMLSLFLNATVNLSNPVGAILGAQSSTTLSVVDINDLDGDGFSNDVETAAGSLPGDATSTPFGTAPAGLTQVLTVEKATIKLNFAKPVLSDSVSFGGTIPNLLPAIPAGTKFTVEVGSVAGKPGVVQVFTFDAKGKSTTKGLTVAKPKNGVSKYSVSLTKGTFAAQLLAAGFTSNEAKTKAPLKVLFTVYFNNVTYGAVKDMEYTVKPAKTGSATLKKF